MLHVQHQWTFSFFCKCVISRLLLFRLKTMHAHKCMHVRMCIQICYTHALAYEVHVFVIPWLKRVVCGFYMSATVLQSAFHALVWTQAKAPSCFKSTLNHASPHCSLILSESYRPDSSTSVYLCSRLLAPSGLASFQYYNPGKCGTYRTSNCTGMQMALQNWREIIKAK